jgi:hypothetical protein
MSLANGEQRIANSELRMLRVLFLFVYFLTAEGLPADGMARRVIRGQPFLIFLIADRQYSSVIRNP